MLVLSSKKNERIFIGDEIVIAVCETTDRKVRIGIEAPHDMKILREELRDHIEREKGKN